MKATTLAIGLTWMCVLASEPARAATGLRNFPVRLESAAEIAPPILADLDGDGKPEVVAAATYRLTALRADGTPLSGFPLELPRGGGVATPLCAGSFGTGAREVVFFGAEDNSLWAVDGAGKALQGFPVKFSHPLAAAPVLGDVDGDGQDELVFGTQDGQLHARTVSGAEAAGFPAKLASPLVTPVTIGKFMPGQPAVMLFGDEAGRLHALLKPGQEATGFPTEARFLLSSQPVLGDLDDDGRFEIVFGSRDYKLYALRADGTAYPGFPMAMPEGCWVTPLIGDINGDGLMEVVALSRSGSVFAVKLLKKGKSASLPLWPMDGQNARRGAATRPNPPRYTALKILPEAPSTTDPLRLEYRFHDLDGDAEPATLIQWIKNGKPVPELDGAREVPAAATRKHDRFKFILRAEAGGRVFESPEVEIRNTPPGPPRVAILPEVARRADNLTMKIEQESADPDGDRIRYSIAWLRDRSPLKGFDKPSVPSAQLRKGQRYTVVVTPHDGESAGPPGRADRTISNTSPGAARIRLDPARPAVTQPVAIVFEQKATDPDGDPVRYRVEWRANGERLSVPEGATSLPAGFVRKGQTLQVTVTSNDGEEDGEKASASAEAQNTPPTAPLVSIQPASPRRGDDLRAQIDKPSLDVDGDGVRYSFRWQKKGGSAPGGTGPRLSGNEVRKGETWTLQVTGHDGEREGAAATAETVIGNRPPSPPRVRPARPRPGTTEDLVVQIVEPAQDADGDAVALEVVWLENGREIQRGPDLLRLPASRTRKHGRYLARLIASDGKDASPPVELGFEVQNTPPGACEIQIEPAVPVRGMPLAARLKAPVADADGDRVEMRYRWFRDGVVFEPGSRSEVVPQSEIRKGQTWTVVGVPFDGEAEGPACEASVAIQNSPPQAPVIAIEPQSPRVTDPVMLKVTTPASDPDGDILTKDIRWSAGGQPLPADGAERLLAGMLRKHQKIRVRVEVSDGELGSGPVEAEVEVANSVPAAPRLVIEPAEPLSRDDLRCSLAAPTLDVDGDALRHEFRWIRGPRPKEKGEKVIAGAVLPEKETERSDRWICKARALDDEAPGPEGEAAVTVGNSAPRAPRVEIQPAAPTAGEALRCVVVEPGQDPDGDAVAYRFRWTKDGVAQPFAPETDTVPPRLLKAKDIWQCSVVASDGKLESPPGESLDVVVGPAM
jgi:hypothetical protein